MAHDDQFTATGPAFTGAGFSRAAFSTNRAGTDSTYGVNVQASTCGVYGESIQTSPPTNRQTPKPNTGVCGIGDDFGVFGKGRTKASVQAETDNHSARLCVLRHARSCRSGVLGINDRSVRDRRSATRSGVWAGKGRRFSARRISGAGVGRVTSRTRASRSCPESGIGVRKNYGAHRLLYCMESPESWFEDFGEAELVNGAADVILEPAFAALIDVSRYQVFLTAYGDTRETLRRRSVGGGFSRARTAGRCEPCALWLSHRRRTERRRRTAPSSRAGAGRARQIAVSVPATRADRARNPGGTRPVRQFGPAKSAESAGRR